MKPLEEETYIPVTEEAPQEPIFAQYPQAGETEVLNREPVYAQYPQAGETAVLGQEPVYAQAGETVVLNQEPYAQYPQAGETEVLTQEPAFTPFAQVPVTPVAPVPQPKPAKAQKPRRRKPHIALRILLQFLSFVMAVVLCAALLGTVVLADMNRLMSAGGIQTLISSILVPKSAPQRITGVVSAGGVLLDSSGFPFPDDLDINDVPEDILGGGDSEENISDLVGWLYDQLANASDKPLNITEEQVQQFVQASTFAEYMAEKLAGYAEDFINGTSNTNITTDEIMGLLEENEDLIKESFNIEFSEEAKESLRQSVDKVVAEQDLNTVIRDQVFDSVEDIINESVSSTGISWNELQPQIQKLCSDTTLYTAIGICLAIVLILCLLNFYNVPAGLTWAGVPCVILGGLLTASLSALSMVGPMFALPDAITQVLTSFASLFMPIHSGLLWTGVGMLVISIVWRVIRSNIRRKR